ncbi:MAG TPA: hypothetical protein VK951_11200 [Miltoncostaeaceae bacterium]|nr:hypothetical protein [Miltoncostaeaceae bacterium]
MKIHEAIEAARIAATYEENRVSLMALRGTITPEVLDVSGVFVLGQPLPEDLRDGVLAAVRDHLDMRLARRNRVSLGRLVELGVDL